MQPLIDELRALDDAGYKNIHVLVMSAAATLFFQAQAEGIFADLQPWSSVMAMAPLVVPLDKDLYNLRNGGQLLGNFPITSFSDAEKARLYVNRPYAVMDELLKLVETFQSTLENGISLLCRVSSCSYKDGTMRPLMQSVRYFCRMD